MFSRFDTIHACDGQTDRQTDGIGVAYTRYSIYVVARKKNVGGDGDPSPGLISNCCQMSFPSQNTPKTTSAGLRPLPHWPLGRLQRSPDRVASFKGGGCFQVLCIRTAMDREERTIVDSFRLAVLVYRCTRLPGVRSPGCL